MERLNWAEERELIRKEALEAHARLHKLFKEDRLSFERERKQAIDALINSQEDEGLQKKMRDWQAAWDRKMSHAGSKENRFVLAQSFFWEHFTHVWRPAMGEFNALLNGPSKVKRS